MVLSERDGRKYGPRRTARGKKMKTEGAAGLPTLAGKSASGDGVEFQPRTRERVPGFS